MSASSTTSSGYCDAKPESALPNASRSESPLLPISCGAASADAIEQPPDFAFIAAERRKTVRGLRTGKFHAAMPVRHVFHERNALSFDRVRNSDGRFSLH